MCVFVEQMPRMWMLCPLFIPRKSPIALKTDVVWRWHNILTGIGELILNAMNSLLYLIAVILIIGWLLGFFVYSAGGLIHALLVLAVIAILINIIRGRAV